MTDPIAPDDAVTTPRYVDDDTRVVDVPDPPGIWLTVQGEESILPELVLTVGGQAYRLREQAGALRIEIDGDRLSIERFGRNSVLVWST